jgi:hypothetical protein
MNKQWIYRNGDKPFSVTEIELPSGKLQYISVSELGGLRVHSSKGVVFTGNGNFDLHSYDLIPYEPYSAFKIDDEVYVKDTAHQYQQICGHFAGVNGNGQPTTFVGGRTSFTEKETVHWLYCEKANKEDK